MKREQIRTILVQVIGAISAVCCPVYGYYPIAMAYFAAAYRCINTRAIVLPIMLGAFWLRAGLETTVKYGVCMLVTSVIYELIISRKRILKNMAASLIMAGVLWVVEAAGGFMTTDPFWYILLGGFEAAVVIGLAGILHMALSSFL